MYRHPIIASRIDYEKLPYAGNQHDDRFLEEQTVYQRAGFKAAPNGASVEYKDRLFDRDWQKCANAQKAAKEQIGDEDTARWHQRFLRLALDAPYLLLIEIRKHRDSSGYERVAYVYWMVDQRVAEFNGDFWTDEQKQALALVIWQNDGNYIEPVENFNRWIFTHLDQKDIYRARRLTWTTGGIGEPTLNDLQNRLMRYWHRDEDANQDTIKSHLLRSSSR